MKKIIATAAIATLLSYSTADAASYNCGKYLCGIVGIKNCGSLALALEWARIFPHTSAQPGAIVVQRRKGRALGGSAGGHVSQIKELTGPCRAIVIDNRGRPYSRDICSRLVAYVSPSRAWTE